MVWLLPKRRLFRKHFLLNTALGIYIFLLAFALLNDRQRAKYGMPLMYTDPAYTDNTESGRCRVHWDSLGEVAMDMLEDPDLSDIEAANTEVEQGGKWRPKNCTAWQKTAIIVPYRDRWHHFKLLLKRLHPMLRKQRIDYQIFCVEQAGEEQFNRAKLMNIGVLEALKAASFDCFIFHDVDLLPENDKNLYYCDGQLRHLASAIDEMRYHVMYYNYAGGVVAVNKENLLRMNGYGNFYWGWGGEDDDFSARSLAAGLQISRPPENIGRFKMARHVKSRFENDQYGLFMSWRSRWRTDGLNSVGSQYKLLAQEEHKLYTRLLVDVGRPPQQPTKQDLPRESYWWFLSFFFP